MRSTIEFPEDKITIVRWTPEQIRLARGRRQPSQEAVAEMEHDARSIYVERFWLGILGPSTTFLLRHLNAELEASPVGFVMHYSELATQMGVNGTGKHSPFMRALHRLCQFDMATMVSPTRLAVRATVPTLSRRHVARLPDPLRQRHEFFLSQLASAS